VQAYFTEEQLEKVYADINVMFDKVKGFADGSVSRS
jgi:hypothetical protein